MSEARTNAFNWLPALIFFGAAALLATTGRGCLILTLVGLWAIVVVVHIGVFVVWGRARGLFIEDVAIFFGPAILRVWVGGLPIRLNLIPLGGYVKFAGNEDPVTPPAPGSFASLPRWEKVGMNLAAPAATLVLAAMLMGPGAAFTSFAQGFRQLFAGTLHAQTVAVPLIAGFFALLESRAFVTVLGVLAAKSATINLTPLPIMNGGLALIEAIQWVVPVSLRTQTRLQVIGLFVALATFLLWTYAAIAFLTRG